MKRRFFISLILIVILSFCLTLCSNAAENGRIAGLEAKAQSVSIAPHVPEIAVKKINAVFLAKKLPKNSSFWIRYLDVGQGDAAIIQCDGHYMMIDGGESSYSSFIYSTLKSLNVSKLDIIVASHAHSDHVGGLAGALNYCKADLVLCPVSYYDSSTFLSFKRYAEKSSTGLTIPSVGDSYMLGSAEIKILGFLPYAEEENDTSLILKITYAGTSFLFTGDAEFEDEHSVLESEYSALLESTVLKVGHHGSRYSTSIRFLREIMPEYAVISVGKDNSYGHPTELILSRLNDAECTVLRTDQSGTVLCTSDGVNVRFSLGK